MDTCGHRMFFLPPPNSGRALRALLVFVAIVLAVASQAGCVMQFGARPKVDRLGGLTRGVSTQADVLLTLGEPRGSGGAVIEPGASPEEIWFYEFLRIRGKKMSLHILLVFFDGKRYDGHLWFRSDERVRRAKSWEGTAAPPSGG